MHVTVEILETMNVIVTIMIKVKIYVILEAVEIFAFYFRYHTIMLCICNTVPTLIL